VGNEGESRQWYYVREEKRFGPVPWQHLRELAAGAHLCPTDLVLCAGAGQWTQAAAVPGLFPPQQAGQGAGELPTLAPSQGDALDATLARRDGKAPAGLPTVPGYEVLGELGRGGMGVVYKARQVKLNRLVALKMILAGGLADGAALARFRSEAQAVAALQHPNVVQVHEVGEHDGWPFFSLEYLDGGSLAQNLDGTPLPPARAAGLVATLARAMDYAHERGILHRDLKPANVLLSADGTPKIADFGLAKQLEGDSGNTQSGTVVGTPSYMAPEQAQASKEIGPRADVYALGAILYELLTGRPPFKAPTPLETLVQAAMDEPVPPSRLNPRVPADLETICLKCLRKLPRKRYLSALRLAEDLERFEAGEPIRARPVGLLERGWKWARRRPALAGLLASLVWLAAAAVLLPTLAWSQAESARMKAESARKKAEGAQKREEEQRLAAEEQRRKARVLSVSLLLDRGISLSEQKDPRGLLWMTRALEVLGNEDADLEHVIRGNLAAWGSQVHPLRFLFPGAQSALFSPDGKTLLTVGYGGILRWDPATGKRLGEIDRDYVPRAAYSADGSKVVSYGYGSTRLWGATSDRPFGEEVKGEGKAQRLALSPNGKLLATATGDTVRLWDAETGRQAGVPLKQPGHVTVLAFRPDSKALLVASGKTARLFDLAGKPLGKVMDQHTYAITLGAFSPDGKWVATACHGGEARLWDGTTGAPHALLQHPGHIFSLAFHPKSTTLLTGCDDQMARFWDVRTGQRTRVPLAHPGPVYTAAFRRDGRQFLTVSGDQGVRLWGDAATPLGAHLPHGHSAMGGAIDAAINPDGKTIVTCTQGTARIWEQAPLPSEAAPELVGLWFGAGGQTAASTPTATRVQLWKISEGQKPQALSKPIDTGEKVKRLALSRDGKTLLTFSEDTSTIRLWDVAHGEARATFPNAVEAYSHDLSDDGAMVLAGGGNKAILYDVKAKKRHELPHPAALRVLTAAFSPDGTLAATGSEDGVVRFWDLTAGGAPITRKLAHRGNVGALAFSRDGKHLLTGSHDATARLWDVSTGKPATVPLPHARAVLAVAISPDGKTLLTGTDSRMHLWDAATGKPLGLPLTYKSRLWNVVFSPDGKTCLPTGWPVRGRVPQPLEGHVDRLTLWVQVRTGMELDQSGTVAYLDAQTWQKRKQVLERLEAQAAEAAR
jgi:WD40 repeat protein/tRNA A-37 threonylcarbamoyl transferase component Bud32